MVSLIPPPSYATVERCAALVPEDWNLVIARHPNRDKPWFCHIMTTEWDDRLVAQIIHGKPGLAQREQPAASFKGWGDTILEAMTAALEAMERV